MAPSPDAALAPTPVFSVRVSGFDGPFDLLLNLIAKHELDITEIALSSITDEFLAHIRAMDAASDDALDETSEFLVVAATLLDLKIVGLLPQGELVDAEDVALLEARDLLFARLLQYRAFKEAAGWFSSELEREGARRFRAVRLEDRFRAQTPELVWTTTLLEFAALAADVFAPREIPSVGLAHLHAPRVSIREQAEVVVARLREGGELGFAALASGAESTGEVVARFLAVLELYRGGYVGLEQLEPLGALTVHWTAADWNDDRLRHLGDDYGD